MRPFFIVYLTDLHFVQFFRIGSEGQVVESPVHFLCGTGAEWLAGLFTSRDADVGYPYDIHCISFESKMVRYERFLGAGSSGIVFEEAGTKAVIKVFSSVQNMELEFKNFNQLHDRIDQLESTRQSVFASVIRQLLPSRATVQASDDRTAIKFPWLGTAPIGYSPESFSLLVRFLQLLHECGFVHRDLRISNLVLVGSILVPIDYGSLCVAGAMVPYLGASCCASDDVLKALACHEVLVTVHPKDDLHSLVRTVRRFLAGDPLAFDASLHRSQDQGTLVKFWAEHLGGWWVRLTQHADACDYDALADDFQHWIQL
jgi:hypothetical protein